MKLRKLARQLAAAAVAGAMTLSLCMPALAETWNISNDSHGFSKVYSIRVAASSSGRTVEMFGGSDSLSHTETDETVLSGSGATFISLNGESVPVVVTLEGLDTKPEVSSPSDACIRTGGDVFKALALGADAVLIARPYVTAVYGGGAEGVACLTEKLGAELADTMRLCGAATLADISQDMVRI